MISNVTRSAVTPMIPAGTKPLTLPPEAQGLKLPPLNMKQLTTQFQSSGTLFIKGVVGQAGAIAKSKR